MAGHTRRSLLLAAGAGAAVLGGCGGSGPRAAAATTTTPVIPQRSDVELLNAALAIEQRTIALYEPTVPLLTGAARQAASLFLAQELQHAGELRKLILLTGAPAHQPNLHYDFTPPHTPRHLLTLLHQLEQEQIAAYITAIPRLSSPQLRQTVASILANDSQHVLVLRSELGVAAIPGPFISATE